MRAQPHLVNFAGALVGEMSVDDIRGKHVALQQEGVVGFESIERFLERAWGRWSARKNGALMSG